MSAVAELFAAQAMPDNGPRKFSGGWLWQLYGTTAYSCPRPGPDVEEPKCP